MLTLPDPVDPDDPRGTADDGYEPAPARRDLLVETADHDEPLYLVCPDCHAGWPAFVGTGTVATLSAQAVALHERSRAALADVDAVRTHVRAHRQAIAFAFAIHGYEWSGWAVDPRDGATLYLLWSTAPSRPDHVEATMRVEALVGDVLGYPIVRVVASNGYTAHECALTVEPAPV